MCNYRMEIKGKIGLSDYSNIYDYIGIVENKDDFLIALKSLGKDDINMICSMLLDRNFSISHKAFDDNGDCTIKACKNL